MSAVWGQDPLVRIAEALEAILQELGEIREATTTPAAAVAPEPTDRLDRLPGFMSRHETAEYLGVTTKTVDRMVRDGRLKATRVGPRLLRISAESIEALLGGEPR